ncbi:MAG TPA: glycosyltransferase [Burkholderiaceae bacterium]|nr:glycosyltransferase [Burkholderiaceae bacterium]HPE02789.1 glycosyltransferase [Burkholderiaceae bacterium]
MNRPALVVFSSLFPSPAEPLAGIFIRERMFRVGQELPITVVAPQPWFPLQSLLRRFKPGWRPERPRAELMQGIEVLRPRYFSVPGVFKSLDGWFMALGSLSTLRGLRARGQADLIDAHFAYPDGLAASKLAQWLRVPYTVTLRGTESRHAADAALRPRVQQALQSASRVFSVSDSLRRIGLACGAAPERSLVVGNGVDARVFAPADRAEARRRLGLPPAAPVLVSVGGLVERKGFHRVIACLPELRRQHPELRLLIVGGPSPEGDWSARLAAQVRELGLDDAVRFLGPLPPSEVRWALSAADVFVLATRNEGWANVLLEAMACGLPVVTTRVGGNAEVVCRDELGIVVPFDDHPALRDALGRALTQSWDRGAIRRYAEANSWDSRVAVLVAEFRRVASEPGSPQPAAGRESVA